MAYMPAFPRTQLLQLFPANKIISQIEIFNFAESSYPMQMQQQNGFLLEPLQRKPASLMRTM